MQTSFPHPLILGHRGSPLEAPENTLRSFALAREQGADGVELDVHLARDGTPVVIHDAKLDRTTPAWGEVAAFDWPALQQLTAAQLPSLEQAAAWAAAASAWVNVEIKAVNAEKATLDVLRRTGALDRVILSSFNPACLASISRLAPDVRRFLLVDAWDAEAGRAVAESGAQGVCLRVDAATAVTLEVIRNDDLPVIVWTVDERPRMLELLRHGVAGIITNRPALGVAARAEVLG
jgi:glycerophosphoryl diester phosphodiesterase